MTKSVCNVNPSNLNAIVSAYSAGLAAGAFLPSVYVLEPVSHCNLHCVMCPNSLLGDADLGEMAIEQFGSILYQIRPYAEHVMMYFMGEPLQHSRFPELLKLARKTLKGRISVSTNAMLLTREVAEVIIPNVDLLICCVDHWSKEKYERIRVGGHFETVVGNIENLLSMRGEQSSPSVLIKSLDFGFADEERERFVSFWKDRGGIPIIGWVNSWAGQFPELRKVDYSPQPYISRERVACADLWFKMVINWKGQVILCCHNYDYSIVIGSLTPDSDLRAVWHSDSIVRFRQAHLNQNFLCNKLCSGCSEWAEIDEMLVYTSQELNDLALVF